MSDRPVSDFLRHHYRHFNAAALVDAAEGYRAHVDGGGKMLVALAGAMSTAEIGLSLAEMIRQGHVHVISCTGANLEEDLFNLVAHDHYERIPNWRDLTPADEQALLERGMNRVTDTCIPEEEAFRRLEAALVDEWHAMEAEGRCAFPHEVLYRIIRSGRLEEFYQIDPKDSWLVAAAQADLPIVTPGWEDSTTGNIFASHVIQGDVQSPHTVKHGIEFMTWLADWYTERADGPGIGFFQIGGGIAGDFPDLRGPDAGAGPRPAHAAVGLLRPDLRLDDQLRLLLGRRPQREDHLGQAGAGHAQLHRRERRDDRGPVDLPSTSWRPRSAGSPPPRWRL